MKWALGVYWIVLAVATHYPRVRIPGEIPSSDKVLHFAAFAVLALLYWRARGRLGGADVALLVAYAALDEYAQQFFGRYTDLTDFIANAAGVVTVAAAVAIRSRSGSPYTRTDRHSPPDSDTFR